MKDIAGSLPLVLLKHFYFLEFLVQVRDALIEGNCLGLLVPLRYLFLHLDCYWIIVLVTIEGIGGKSIFLPHHLPRPLLNHCLPLLLLLQQGERHNLPEEPVCVLQIKITILLLDHHIPALLEVLVPEPDLLLLIKFYLPHVEYLFISQLGISLGDLLDSVNLVALLVDHYI